MRRLGLLLLMVVSCTSPASPDTGAGDSSTSTSPPEPTTTPSPSETDSLPVPAPTVPDGPLSAEVAATVDRLVGSAAGGLDLAAVAELANYADPRVSWLTVRVTDGIRVFAPDGSELVTHQAFWFAWSQFSTRRHWSGRRRAPDTMRR